MSEEYKEIRYREPFLVRESAAQNDERILTYTTHTNTQYLSVSTTLFGGGTFKMASTWLTQLFTLHSVVLGYTMPLIYALTMKRQEDIYTGERTCICTGKKSQHLPSIVRDRFWDCKCECNLTTPTKCTNKIMLVSFFTYNVVKNIISGSSKWVYDDRIYTHKCASMLFGLSFVPLEDVNEIFEHIIKNAEENLDGGYRLHWQSVCLWKARQMQKKTRSSKFSTPNLKCLCISTEQCSQDKQFRGSWHRKFQKLTIMGHPSIWRFIKVLKAEQQSNE